MRDYLKDERLETHSGTKDSLDLSLYQFLSGLFSLKLDTVGGRVVVSLGMVTTIRYYFVFLYNFKK